MRDAEQGGATEGVRWLNQLCVWLLRSERIFMFLREYLYVDLDKVAGFVSQLYDGVPEKATNVSARQKKVEADFKLIRGSRGASMEDAVERQLGDSLFKDLEADLEALGLLEDVSALLAEGNGWAEAGAKIAPGKIVRITSPGTLFHPSQMSDAIAGIATAALGLDGLNIEQSSTSSSRPVPPRAKTESQKRSERANRAAEQLRSEFRFPEDLIPGLDPVPYMDIPRSTLVGMVQVVRGVFGEGLHLHLRPNGSGGPVVTARLEQGRRFLDSSPEVLFSRYGLAEQEWTLVGIVGQVGAAAHVSGAITIVNEDGSVNRASFVDLVGEFLATAGGLVDLPRAPGFSVVPLALYRTVGISIDSQRME